MSSLLKNTLNTRWIIVKGQNTVTLRSDHLDRCDEEDIKKLENYGIKAVVDLRRNEEDTISLALKKSSIQYYSIPIDDIDFDLSKFIDDTGAKTRDERKVAVGDFYYYAMKSLYQKQMLDVLKVYNRYDGHILVHCTYGKDRTGMIAFLIQKYLQATPKEIEDDYVESAKNLEVLGLKDAHKTTIEDSKSILYRFYDLIKDEEQEILNPYMEVLQNNIQ